MKLSDETGPEAVRHMAASLIENSGDFIALASLEGNVLYINEAGCRLLEGGPDSCRNRPMTDFLAPDDLPYFNEVILGELTRSGRWSGDFRFRTLRDDTVATVSLAVFYVSEEATGRPTAIALVGKDIGDRRRAEMRLRALVDAGAILSHSLDYDATFDNIAELVTRAIATFCIIDIFDPEQNGGRVARVAVSHIDRSKLAILKRVATYVPLTSQSSHPVIRAIADGSSSLVAIVDDEWLERNASTDLHLTVHRELGTHSLVTVPLAASGKILGALTCGLGIESPSRAASKRPFDAEDLFFVEELGRRAGAVIENARLYQHQRHIAVELQAASLPETLAEVDHLRLDAAYRPGSAEATIGGDWYDAFALEDGRIVLTVGDVLGHGLHAAITMTKLRQAMQSAAMVNADPNVMLDVADKTLRMHDASGFATALAAVYDPRTKHLTFASAGHPGPALATTDGRVEEFESPGLLLGMRTGLDRGTRAIELPADSVLVFFTDGLVEATRDLEEGHQRLRDTLARPEIVGHANPATAIVEAVLGGRAASDDIAVLVATVAPPAEPAGSGAQTEYSDAGANVEAIASATAAT